MTEDERVHDLRLEVVRENLMWGEEQRKRSRDYQQLARKQWDRLRETVRQGYFDAWLEDVAYRLERPRDTVRLLSIAETYALQDAKGQATYLWRTGQIPGFENEVRAAQVAEVYRLLGKLAKQLPDAPVHLLCGADVLWLRHGEPERWGVWGNGSGYFGAIEATSAEVLANASLWLDRDDDVAIAMLSAADGYDSLSFFWGRDQRGTFCIIQLIGPQWGQFLADERSEWTYDGWLEKTVRLRMQGDGGIK